MARANPEVDYVADLLRLRETYPKLSPSQRLNIIRQRLEDHHFGPNRLVTSVSAVEGLARSLVIRLGAKGKGQEALAKAYRRNEKSSAKNLVEQYLLKKAKVRPEEHFGEETWKLFCHAENFRNLVVHECTYLGIDKFPSLISACEEVLEGLVRMAKIRERRT